MKEKIKLKDLRFCYDIRNNKGYWRKLTKEEIKARDKEQK